MYKMKQEVDIAYNKVCCACLSSDRDLVFIIGQSDIYQIFRLLMYDVVGDKFEEPEETLQVCWECLAQLRRFDKFKKQVHTAQETILSLKENHENTDHTYFSQSLSTLGLTIKNGYDFCYDSTNKIQTEWTPKIVAVSFGSNIMNELNNGEQMLGSTQILENSNTIVKPQILIKQEPLKIEDHNEDNNNTVIPKVTISIGPQSEDKTDLSLVQAIQSNDSTEEKTDLKAGHSMEYMNDEDTLAVSTGPLDKADEFIVKSHKLKDSVEEKLDSNLYPSFEINPYITEYMNDEAMLAFREKAKEKIQYASAAYKCDLCILGFDSQKQVDEHYVLVHKARAGTKACKICLVYIEEEGMSYHMQSHYVRHVCRMCGHTEASTRLAQVHVQQHLVKKPPSALINIGDVATANKDLKKEMNDEDSESNIASPNSGKQVFRKLSKNAVVAYKCLECDMFFQTNKTRKLHVAKYHNRHSPSLECDLCNKLFANRSTLIRHLRLHEGPLPRKECPICQKLVRMIDLKYHVQRHQTKGRYECRECKKVFSHISTYQGHLKYTRAHASDHVFKFQCPMCNKGYSTKKAMQDHFNYHHLGKTSHKCLICNKPMATKACVERHMMRVHGEKKEKPRTHICEQCGKAFADKKTLIQHEITHSGARPLSCDICQQTFKHKASLYTHRKRVHNIAIAKKVVEFMDTQNAGT